VKEPYADIAAFYDAEFDGAEGDAVFFAGHAATGPLLVLGCGTGRLCAVLPQRPTTGLDRSESMLERARRRGLPTRFVQGDIRDFSLGSFGEILLPNATFAFLHTRADQLACLEACARALPTGGLLTLDLPAPDFAHLAHAHTPERVAWEGWMAGKPARRTREIHRRPLAGRLDLHDRYFLDDVLVAETTLPLLLSTPRELEWVCEAAGFWVDAMYGDYGGGPLREGCDRILVRAWRC
jgi:SAM-dependent methyltransferase